MSRESRLRPAVLAVLGVSTQGLVVALPSAATPPSSSGPSAARTTARPAAARPTTIRPVASAVAEVPDCGGVIVARTPTTTWTCTFHDEFDGTGLDRTTWNVMESSQWGWHSGDECFVDHPDNVSVSGGSLSLSVQKVPKRFLCSHGDGGAGWETQHTGGMVTSWGHFSQTYGRFEIRAAFPSQTVRGVQSALWLYPLQHTYGHWPLSGEIDVAEFYSRSPDRAVPTLHYGGGSLQENRTNTRCLVDHPEQFHTYLLEWSPSMIRISFDGVPCLVNSKWSPLLPLQHPQPFDHPFTLNLTQALGTGLNSPLDNSTVRTPFPATMRVDYVRAWQ